MAVPLNVALPRVLILLFAGSLRSASAFAPAAPAALSRMASTAFLSPLRPATRWAAAATVGRKQRDPARTGLEMKGGGLDIASVAAVVSPETLNPKS